MQLTRQRALEAISDIIKTDRYKMRDGAFERALNAATEAFNDARPLKGSSSLKLETGKKLYSAPICLREYLGSDWGQENTPQYRQYTPPPPRVFSVLTPSGSAIEFSSAPTQLQIDRYGCDFHYYYAARHTLTDNDSTIHEKDNELFITRALAALMRELVAANVTEPVVLHRGVSPVRESTPYKAYELLMREYRAGI